MSDSIFDYPPFWTQQRNLDTEQRRKDDWVAFIVGSTQKSRQTELLVEKEVGGALFSNKKIKRSLDAEHIRLLLDHMQSRGNGEWMDEEKTKFMVLWKSLAEWSSIIHRWVDATGQIGGVFTVYELLEGTATEGEEFHGIERDLMDKVLDYMEENGKAKIFSASDPSKKGVKFFA